MAKKYAVKTVFDTIQGEGGRTGARSVFLRLAGCNAWSGRPQDRAKGAGACAAWCDTDFFGGKALSLEAIVGELERAWPKRKGEDRWVVISGGEPCLQLDAALVEGLHEADWHIAVETNGSVECPALDLVDWLTISPKRGLEINPGNLAMASELKVVLPGVAPGKDRGWTDAELEYLAGHTVAAQLYVQPQDPIDLGFVEVSHLHENLGHRERDLGAQMFQKNLERCLDLVRRHTHWRLCLQTHKFINLP